MANFFDKITSKFKKQTNVQQQSKTSGDTKQINEPVKYDFVEQYTLVAPNQVFASYSLWSLCPTMPVAYESKDAQNSGWCKCVQLPTAQPFMEYLAQLKNARPEITANPKNRTISIINMEKGKRIFILPNLKNPKNPVFIVDFETGDENAWFLHVTPQINRAIVKQLKTIMR